MIAAACILTATILVVAAYRFWSIDLLIRTQQRRVVVIELRGGETFKGLLVRSDSRSLLLRNVTALASEQTTAIPVDGELLVPRQDVKYMQRP